MKAEERLQQRAHTMAGWLGGPPLYINERGHPRLRMRQAPYAIAAVVRNEWMLCMHPALAEQVADPALPGTVEQAFTGMAEHRVNSGQWSGHARWG